jgi:hypothetical protein
MPLIRLLHALTTGAATFGLNPSLPPVALQPKAPREAFSEDAQKLRGDFDRAFVKLQEEVQTSSGQSITAKT